MGLGKGRLLAGGDAVIVGVIEEHGESVPAAGGQVVLVGSLLLGKLGCGNAVKFGSEDVGEVAGLLAGISEAVGRAISLVGSGTAGSDTADVG